MAAHFTFDRTGTRAGGYRLGRIHESTDNLMRWAVEELATMAQMLESNDGSQDAHFAPHVAAYGFASDAKAKAAYAELASFVGKLTNNGSQSNTLDAITQFRAQFRN